MTETLQTALAPLLIIGSFCSLGLFEYPIGQSRPYLSCLYTLTTWSYFTYSYYYPVYFNNWRKDEVLCWMRVIEIIAAIASILISYLHFKELKMCLHEISIVDDTLEALGMPKEYQRLRNWIIRIIIGWIAYIFFFLATYFCWVFLNISKDIYFVAYLYTIFLASYPEFLNILSGLIWGTIYGYISFRFRQVNDRLQLFCSDFFENNTDRRQNRYILVRQWITGIKDCKQYICIIMHVHLKLCLISRKLNKIFNIQMLLQMLWIFLRTILFYTAIYLLLTANKQMIIWTFTSIYNYLCSFSVFILRNALCLTLNYICQSVYCKINKTVAILHKLSNYNLDENLDEQILQFILQIKLREVKFGIGFFHFGYNFICQFYSTALSVLMIMISLDLMNHLGLD